MYNTNNCTTCTVCGDCHKIPTESDSPTLFCMHCDIDNAPCLNICKQNAIFKLGGAITLDNKKCNKCRECMNVCPINIIQI